MPSDYRHVNFKYLYSDIGGRTRLAPGVRARQTQHCGLRGFYFFVDIPMLVKSFIINPTDTVCVGIR